ncbi:hypothetical protein V2O64_24200 (plasmid) [Verrucomicrobiaceae bacterium 227]
MNKSIDYGIEACRLTVATLEPQIDYGPDDESQDEPWSDTPKFRKCLEGLELGDSNIEPSQVREHFVVTNKNLGDFLRASEENRAELPKDWYDARDEAAKTK